MAKARRKEKAKASEKVKTKPKEKEKEISCVGTVESQVTLQKTAGRKEEEQAKAKEALRFAIDAASPGTGLETAKPKERAKESVQVALSASKVEERKERKKERGKADGSRGIA